MAKNVNEMRVLARQKTIDLLDVVLKENEAVQFGDASFAILQEVDGEEIWTEVTVKSKVWKPTTVAAAFNPYEVEKAWKAEKEIKAKVKAQKAKEHDEKVKKAKEA